jgi:hypothetical protein
LREPRVGQVVEPLYCSIIIQINHRGGSAIVFDATCLCSNTPFFCAYCSLTFITAVGMLPNP